MFNKSSMQLKTNSNFCLLETVIVSVISLLNYSLQEYLNRSYVILRGKVTPYVLVIQLNAEARNKSPPHSNPFILRKEGQNFITALEYSKLQKPSYFKAAAVATR